MRRMLLAVVIPIGFFAVAHGQALSANISRQSGSYPFHGEQLTLTCYHSTGCALPLQWNYWNTSNANIIWSGLNMSAFGTSLGVSGLCANVSVNCNITMTADRYSHNGPWTCLCFSTPATVAVDIYVLVTEVYPVSPKTWEIRGDFQTNLTCNTSCAYPAPMTNWTSSQILVQSNIKHWTIPCDGQAGLVSAYSSFMVDAPKNGDWFRFSVGSVQGRPGNAKLSAGAKGGIGAGCAGMGLICSGVIVYIVIRGKKSVTVLGTGPDGDIGVTIAVKGTEGQKPSPVIVKGSCTIERPGDGTVILKTGADEPSGESMVVEGIKPDGQKVAVFVIALSEDRTYEEVEALCQALPSVAKALVVEGTGPNGTKATAFVIQATWANGKQGETVILVRARAIVAGGHDQYPKADYDN